MPYNIKNEPIVTRDDILLQELVLLDGQPSSGKAAIDPIVASAERVELLKYTPEIENICALRHLGKITDDAAETMIKLQADLVLYEIMMSRNLNFRPSDQSSAFKNYHSFKYLKRLFAIGDSVIPEKIIKERPILYFITHMLLALSEPILNSFVDKISIIEFVRHPMSMLHQRTFYHECWYTPQGQMRQFQVFIKHHEEQVPFWTRGWEELYVKSNPVERAIYEMRYQTEITDLFKEKHKDIYGSHCITIPFERFVVDPWPYIKKIEVLLKTNISQRTKKVLKKQGIPRKITGVEPQELIKVRNIALKKGACVEAMEVLEEISKKYEVEYDL